MKQGKIRWSSSGLGEGRRGRTEVKKVMGKVEWCDSRKSEDVKYICREKVCNRERWERMYIGRMMASPLEGEQPIYWCSYLIGL